MKNVNETRPTNLEEVITEIDNLRTVVRDYLPYYSGNGSPENSEYAQIGAFYSDLKNGKMYQKKGTKGGRDGWEILGVPPGVIEAYAGSTIPKGWLDCDGSAVYRSVYPDLFSAIGTTWGSGDGSNTFNLPDLRSATLRGAGTPTIFTSNDAITLAQTVDDQFQGHWHEQFAGGRTASGGDDRALDDSSNVNLVAVNSNGDPTEDDSSNGTPRTGAETTGKARGIYWIIKT
jgi:microcystin-dependent protein